MGFLSSNTSLTIAWTFYLQSKLQKMFVLKHEKTSPKGLNKLRIWVENGKCEINFIFCRNSDIYFTVGSFTTEVSLFTWVHLVWVQVERLKLNVHFTSEHFRYFLNSFQKHTQGHNLFNNYSKHQLSEYQVMADFDLCKVVLHALTHFFKQNSANNVFQRVSNRLTLPFASERKMSRAVVNF